MPTPQQVHAEALVIDTHADTPQRFVDEGWDFCGPGETGLGGGMLNLETALAGNLAAEFFAIWVEPHEWKGRFAHRTLQLIDGVYEQLRKHPHEMRLGLTADDIVQAKQDGVFCVLLGVEGGHSIENDLGLLRVYHQLGVRYMTLTWSNTNEWADSSGDIDDASVQHHGGLTAFGREVVREMNRLGMMVDVSHVSDATLEQVLETSSAPVLASHSSARALTNSPRNLTDDQMRAIAATGGAVMVNFYASFVDERWRQAWSATSEHRAPLYAEVAGRFHAQGKTVPYSAMIEVDRKFYAEHMHGVPLPDMSAIVDHIDHVAKVAGVNHVGIGTDFDGFSFLPQGIATAADLPKLTEALMARGYSAEEMKKLLGGNLLRVMRAVETAAE